MKVITFFRVNLLKTIRQYRVVLSIDVDYLEMLVEGQIQPICQFHLVFILVHFNLLYRLRWISDRQTASKDGKNGKDRWGTDVTSKGLRIKDSCQQVRIY